MGQLCASGGKVAQTRPPVKDFRAKHGDQGGASDEVARASCLRVNVGVPPRDPCRLDGETPPTLAGETPALRRRHCSLSRGQRSAGREFPECRCSRFEPLSRRRRTSNIQHPTSNTQWLPFAQSLIIGRWMLDQHEAVYEAIPAERSGGVFQGPGGAPAPGADAGGASKGAGADPSGTRAPRGGPGTGAQSRHVTQSYQGPSDRRAH